MRKNIAAGYLKVLLAFLFCLLFQPQCNPDRDNDVEAYGNNKIKIPVAQKGRGID
ncbi:MAG TPA: hypothetical protein VJB66_05150 [Candidatus Nanoarchaeia archaeon]|nr:hypothetical protein [Candidatus Nanoarchaeia archaeon]